LKIIAPIVMDIRLRMWNNNTWNVIVDIKQNMDYWWFGNLKNNLRLFLSFSKTKALPSQKAFSHAF